MYPMTPETRLQSKGDANAGTSNKERGTRRTGRRPKVEEVRKPTISEEEGGRPIHGGLAYWPHPDRGVSLNGMGFEGTIDSENFEEHVADLHVEENTIW